MTRGMTSIDEIKADFALLEEWEDRYRYVIELGRELPALSMDLRTDDTKVRGCASQVWLVTERGGGQDPVLTFRGDSDAHIVRGLVAILLAIYSGQRAADVLAIDGAGIFSSLGLSEHLTPQRSNGLASMISRIRSEARAALSAAQASA
jgi:cysteine desulfuration protein SufE